jgi:hypothetical protein
MRRIILITLAAATLAATGCAARSFASQTAAPAAAHQQTASAPSASATDSRDLAARLARARLATARYTTSLDNAKADGYQIITRMIPGMGWHFLDPTIKGFDARKPAILVYERHGRSWQLGALEWVFSAKPASPPLPGATYGPFGAACTTAAAPSCSPASRSCAPSAARDRCAVHFWHPDLATLHVWVWYPKPGRPLQRHQPSGPTLQPRLDHASIRRPGSEPAWARVPASTDGRRKPIDGAEARCTPTARSEVALRGQVQA